MKGTAPALQEPYSELINEELAASIHHGRNEGSY